MGCDIHCYIEYKRAESEHWSDFGGRINPGRNYWMFGAMAGVRREDLAFIDPRGVPNDIAYHAFNDWTIYVSDDQAEDYKHVDGETYYSKAHASAYVAKGYCQYFERNGHKDRWVTNSDWHSASWHTSDEFELAIATYLKASGFQVGALRLNGPSEASKLSVLPGTDAGYALSCITEYWAILAAMRCFEMQGHKARLVFWFDN